MDIKIMNAYTHAENGASNHILKKSNFILIEEYLNNEGVTWKWWQIENK